MRAIEPQSTGGMRFGGDAGDKGPRIGFAPLVDVVLLLICFYLFVIDSFERYQQPDIRLPVMQSEAATEQHPAELIVNVGQEGGIRVNGNGVPLDRLSELLAAERDRRDTADRRLRVVVRIDRRQRYRRLDRVLNACRSAGLSRINLRTTREGSP